MPFKRFSQLNAMVEGIEDWKRVDAKTEASELDGKPTCWTHEAIRLVALRNRTPRQRKGPFQLAQPTARTSNAEPGTEPDAGLEAPGLLGVREGADDPQEPPDVSGRPPFVAKEPKDAHNKWR